MTRMMKTNKSLGLAYLDDRSYKVGSLAQTLFMDVKVSQLASLCRLPNHLGTVPHRAQRKEIVDLVVHVFFSSPRQCNFMMVEMAYRETHEAAMCC